MSTCDFLIYYTIKNCVVENLYQKYKNWDYARIPLFKNLFLKRTMVQNYARKQKDKKQLSGCRGAATNLIILSSFSVLLTLITLYKCGDNQISLFTYLWVEQPIVLWIETVWNLNLRRKVLLGLLSRGWEVCHSTYKRNLFFYRTCLFINLLIFSFLNVYSIPLCFTRRSYPEWMINFL